MLHLWNPVVDTMVHRIAAPHWQSRFTYSIHALCYIVSGDAAFTLDGTPYHAQTGGMFYFIPGNVLEITAVKQTEFYTVHFMPNALSGTKEERLFAEHTTMVQTLLMRRNFEENWKKWTSKSIGYEWKCKLLLMQALDQLYDQFHSKSPHKLILVERMIAFMAARKSERMTLQELSQFLEVSTSYAARVFHELIGCSPMLYFNRMKIDEAKGMLLSTSWTVKEISHSLGFADEFYFSRLFKQVTGMSPAKYRLSGS